ncbi:hypothetical protein NLU14_16745 [Marinobacter sp. 71-i]|uniref:Uncharacterized protein n=1 Tax=Marinobacter iranensis TaxID=2962607 RepID=A0ABT5YE74_9GAMM|nr:glycosyltransferase family 9 protein [Marinobacter iranensis]MDF0751879.1 hypothetical protein [Marinobacter iranensis]
MDKLVTIPRHSSFSGDFVERIKVLRTLRRERYDLVIDSQNKPSSQYLTLLSGAGIRLGYDHRRWMSWVYNLRASKGPQRYQASMRFDILKPLGIEEEPFQLSFPIPPEDQAYIDQWLEQEALARRKFVVISPGSRQERKKWRTDYYAEVADCIQTDFGLPVVLLWAPDEWHDVENMSKRMQTSPLMAPPTTLEQGVALLNRCRLLLCNDSGFMCPVAQPPTTTASESRLPWFMKRFRPFSVRQYDLYSGQRSFRGTARLSLSSCVDPTGSHPKLFLPPPLTL